MKVVETSKPGTVDPKDEIEWDISDDGWFLAAVGQGVETDEEVEELDESGPDELDLVGGS